MNDRELEQRLRSARVPGRNEDYWEDFPRTVTARIGRAAKPMRVAPRILPRLIWSFGFAAACLLIAIAVWRPRAANEQAYAFLQDEKVIRETLELFPNQVRAIIQDSSGTRLVLSERPDVPNSPPLWIRICNGKECRVVVTFSGQSFQVAKETVEVLADAQGQVMLVGDQLFWSAAEQSRSARSLRIQARPLEML